MKTFIDICKMTSTEAYRQGWIDGHCADSKYPHTIKFMGLGIEKLSEIVNKHLDEEFYSGQQWTPEQMENLKNRQAEINKNKENKMTREEAIKNCCHGIVYPEAFIQALEALGLIKFDETKEAALVINNVKDVDGDTQKIYLHDMEKALAAYGFEIIPKGPKS